MRMPWSWLIFCHLTLVDSASTSSGLDVGKKPGFPKFIKPSDPGVQKAARFAVERYNNCTNDLFLFKELHIDKAMVQLVKGLKYMIDMHISRTICKKNEHYNLDNCTFQTNRTLQQTFNCYTEVWVISWLQKTEVLVLHCQ
ncbi:cystatin-F isoform X2 [Notamacropus eugenii]|uniref:cystatin-F isoform X2 n=1 Tax=Notamacropus eugenii TaxID=9315 RepID=UPI003B677267